MWSFYRESKKKNYGRWEKIGGSEGGADEGGVEVGTQGGDD